MSQAGSEAQSRPLLVNGEALKVDVTAPNTGGGPKPGSTDGLVWVSVA